MAFPLHPRKYPLAKQAAGPPPGLEHRLRRAKGLQLISQDAEALRKEEDQGEEKSKLISIPLTFPNVKWK